jgi:hypothetical protein
MLWEIKTRDHSIPGTAWGYKILSPRMDYGTKPQAPYYWIDYKLTDNYKKINMFWNKKKKNDGGEVADTQKMGMLQRLAMRKLEKMDPKEREKVMQKALSPENIAKNKDKILETMEQMKAAGQMTDEQIRMAKEKLGL